MSLTNDCTECGCETKAAYDVVRQCTIYVCDTCEGKLPDDYEGCSDCGFDHEYEFEQAHRFHTARGSLPKNEK